MDREGLILIVLLASGGIAIIAGAFILSSGISQEHLSVADCAGPTGYDRLYVIDDGKVTETSLEDITPGSIVLMGSGWIADNDYRLKDIMTKFIDDGSTVATISDTSVFDLLKPDVAMDFEPSAKVHGRYKEGRTSYCLSLSYEEGWIEYLSGDGWKSDELALSVKKNVPPRCISTTAYRSGSGPTIVSTNLLWTTNGSTMPVSVFTDGDVLWISPDHGFYVVSFIDIDTGGCTLQSMVFRTQTDTRQMHHFPANVSFDKDRYNYSMPEASWSIPREENGPTYCYCDAGGKWEKEDFYAFTEFQYPETIAGYSKPTASHSSYISAGSGFYLLDDSYDSMFGTNSVTIEYHKDLVHYTFDIKTGFSLPVVKKTTE